MEMMETPVTNAPANDAPANEAPVTEALQYDIYNDQETTLIDSQCGEGTCEYVRWCADYKSGTVFELIPRLFDDEVLMCKKLRAIIFNLLIVYENNEIVQMLFPNFPRQILIRLFQFDVSLHAYVTIETRFMQTQMFDDVIQQCLDLRDIFDPNWQHEKNKLYDNVIAYLTPTVKSASRSDAMNHEIRS